jgi:chromosome segregation ATPase
MKLNRLTADDLERALDLVLHPEAAKNAKDRMAQIAALRDEANASIDAHNERERKLEEWELELSQMDKTFDGQRQEIRNSREALKRDQAALQRGQETLESQKQELVTALEDAASREAAARQASVTAEEAIARAERVRVDAVAKAQAADAKRLEYEGLLARADELLSRKAG